MKVLYAPTIRYLVNEVNRIGVQKDSIITLLKEGEQYVLIYY